MRLHLLPPDRCQFPLWADERPTHRHCGEPTALLSAYCAVHHARCYRGFAPPLPRDDIEAGANPLEVRPC